MALTIDKIKTINIPINVSRKPDNYPPSSRGISLYNDSVNLYDAINLFMASAPPATLTIGEGLLGNGSVLSPLSWAGVNHTSALSGNGTVGSPLDVADKGISLSKLAQSGATLNQIIKWDGTNWVPANETGGATSFVPLDRTLTINGTTYDLSQDRSWNITSMIYPSAGIPVSTGSAWGTSITNNSTNWNTAFSWGNHALAGYLTSASIGTIATQNANNVNITGGSITGITDLAVADGGTGASTASGALINLLPSYTGNATKVLAINSGATGVEWVTVPLGTGWVPYTGATSNIDLGTYGYLGDYLKLNTAPDNIPTTAGTLSWNAGYQTADLKLNDNVTLQLGQEQLIRVVNKTGTDLTEAAYKAVRLTGAQGQRPSVNLAQANSELTSAETIGLVTENINDNQEGFVTTFGLVNEINTTGTLQGETWLDGDTLYLSPTVAGGITKVKPTAPNHLVIIGYVVYAHANHGKIFVKVNNGYELDELHNVLISNPQSNEILKYDGTKWINGTAPATVAGNNTEIQYNNSGSLGASSNFTWDYTNNQLKLGSIPTTTTTASGILAIESTGGVFKLSLTGSSLTLSSTGTLDVSTLPFNKITAGQAQLTGSQNIAINYSNTNSGLLVSNSGYSVLGSPDGLKTLTVDDTGVYTTSSTAIGTNSINPNAILSLNSTTKGLLLPTVSTTDRDLMNLPSDGIMIYNPSVGKFQGRAGNAWVDFGGGGSAAGNTGEIQFNNAGAFGASSNLFWDNAKRNLGIGTTSIYATGLEIKNTTEGETLGINNGPELLTTANTAAGWTGTSFATGYTHTTGTTALTASGLTVTSGVFYTVVVTVSNRTAGTVTATIGGLTTGAISTNTTVTIPYSRTTGTQNFTLTPTTDFNGTVVASVKLTLPSKPVFAAENSSGTVTMEMRAPVDSTNTVIGVDAGGYINSGTNAVILGYRANRFVNSVQNNVVAIGANTSVTSDNSTAVGSSITLTGHGSVALGNSAAAAGLYSVALGTSSNASAGYFGTAVGCYSGVTGNSGIALGYASVAGQESISIGRDISGAVLRKIVIGGFTAGGGANTTFIGYTDTTQTHLYGNLTLGLTTADATTRLKATAEASDSTRFAAKFQNLTGGNLLSVRGDGAVIGNVISEINVQTASYTLALSDANKIVEMNVATANTVTVPDSTVGFPVGTNITIIQAGAGQTTITPVNGTVVIQSANGWNKINAQYGAVTLVKKDANTWYLFGNLNA